jgi:Tfp pilus assembly PilM family ATPase
MKKITLKVDAVPHWHALGISSAERDYRLCYLINKSLGMDFAREAMLQVFLPDQESRTPVQAFVAKEIETQAVYYLLKNRQENFYLIPKWKKADYIVLAGNEASQEGLEKLSRDLARIPDIQSTFAIPTDQTFHIDVE